MESEASRVHCKQRPGRRRVVIAGLFLKYRTLMKVFPLFNSKFGADFAQFPVWKRGPVGMGPWAAALPVHYHRETVRADRPRG